MAARGCNRTARDMFARRTMTHSARFRPCLQNLHPTPAITRTVASSSWLSSRHIPNKPTKKQPATGTTQPDASDTQCTFDHRLKFLQVHSRPPHVAVRKNRYKPGFQPGDFMCPQCGSHNHKPPEYNQGFTTQSSVLSLGLGSDQEPDASSQPPTTRSHPAGASPVCFECGYETRIPYTLPPNAANPHSPSSVSTSSAKPLQESGLLGRDITGTHEEEDDDIRRPKPRDYVCPNCRTLNFSGRLYCIGCGILNTRAKSRIFKRAKR